MRRIALGLMRISKLNVDEVEELMLNAIDLGINFFDLADIYGHGKCEELVGEVLKRNPNIREKIYLQSKVGIAYETIGYDNSYDYIVSACMKCLKRLNTNYLDCLLIHRVDIFMDADEVKRAVDYLKDNGYIKDFGVSNFNTSEIEYLKSRGLDIKYNQISLGIGNTLMLDQVMYTNVPTSKVIYADSDLFFYMKRNDIAIQAWSPFIYGFFEESIFDNDKYPLINEILEEYANKYHSSKCAIASAFLLKLDKNLIVISGSCNIDHIKECLDGEKIELDRADWYTIYKRLGHLLP